MFINSISDLRKAFRHGPYAWPGGYPTFFVTSDGACLSRKAARAELRQVLEALRDNDTRCGWHVCALEVNWESELYCEHTGKPIESAYEAVAEKMEYAQAELDRWD